jgi:hypothetical protein
MPDLFISHASEDKEAIALPLADRLIQLGYDVWYDDYSLARAWLPAGTGS